MRPLFQSSIDRRGRTAGRWTAAGVLMIGLHVSGGAAGYIYWGARPVEIMLPPPTVIAFELAPMPVAPPPPQKIEEPIPEIEPVVEPPPPITELDLIPPAPPEVKPVVALPEKPKPIKKKKKKKEPEKKKLEKKKPVETEKPPQDFKTATDAPSDTKVETPPQPVQAAAPVAAGPTPDELSRISNAKNMWMLAFQKHFNKHRKYPKSAMRKNQEGTPTVIFAIDRQGNLIEARVSHASGVESLDKEAVATLYRATPLPAVPPEMEGELLQFEVPIGFSLTNAN